MTSLLMSSASISIWYPRFRCRYSNSRDASVVEELLPFPAPPPEGPGELTRRLIQVFNWEFNSCTTQSELFVAMVVLLFNILQTEHLHYLDSKQTSRPWKERKLSLLKSRKTLSFNFLPLLLVRCQHDVYVLCSLLFQLLLWLQFGCSL